MSEPVAEKEAGPAQEPATNGADSTAPPEKRKREYKDFGHEEEKATRMCSTIFFHHPIPALFHSLIPI